MGSARSGRPVWLSSAQSSTERSSRVRDETRDGARVRAGAGGRDAEAFPELVALVEQPGIARARAESALVGGAGCGWMRQNVEIADAEIAPRDRVVGFEFYGALPKRDRLAMAAAIIEQIAEIKRRAGIARIGGDGVPQDRDLLQPRGKAIVGRGLRARRRDARRAAFSSPSW